MCEVTIVAMLNMLYYFRNVIVGKPDKIKEIETKRRREREKRRKKRTGDMCQTLVTLVEVVCLPPSLPVSTETKHAITLQRKPYSLLILKLLH